MAKKWQIPESIAEAVENARAALEEAVSDIEMQWDEMSEKWQEGERGEAVRAWFESLSDQVEELESIHDSIETEPDF